MRKTRSSRTYQSLKRPALKLKRCARRLWYSLKTCRMDFVMDALLGSLEELVPYTCARVLALEGGSNVLALGERQIPAPPQTSPKYHPGFPLTLTTDESPLLMRVLEERKSVLVSDAKLEKDWETFKGHAHFRSWLSVPLIASGECWGLLSIGHTDPNLKRPSSPCGIVGGSCRSRNSECPSVCPRRNVCVRAGKASARTAGRGNCAGSSTARQKGR